MEPTTHDRIQQYITETIDILREEPLTDREREAIAGVLAAIDTLKKSSSTFDMCWLTEGYEQFLQTIIMPE